LLLLFPEFTFQVQGILFCKFEVFTIRSAFTDPFFFSCRNKKFLLSLNQLRIRECLMPAIVHFDVPTEDVERAKKFYSALFGWKFEPFPEMQYNLFTTTNLDGTPGVGGGMGKRMDASQRIMNYFGVPSIDAAMKQVKSLGGKVLSEKMAVPGMGFLATCIDTEGNLFGLWEETTQAR
jgi:predicted enzyme related to lactoylglutathione lyase